MALDPFVRSTVNAQGVREIRFFHPKANSLTRAMLTQLAAAVRESGGDPGTKVVVIASEGTGAFCAGASFEELQAVDTEEAGQHYFMGFAEVLMAIRSCPRLVIARVQGKAVGGGVGIIAASDYVIASESTALRLSEFELGLGPFVIGPAVQHRIGAAAFGAMALDCAWRDAAWGARLGLLTQVVSGERLDDTVLTVAAGFAGREPLAAQALKTALWEGVEPWEDLLPRRAQISGRLVRARKSSR